MAANLPVIGCVGGVLCPASSLLVHRLLPARHYCRPAVATGTPHHVSSEAALAQRSRDTARYAGYRINGPADRRTTGDSPEPVRSRARLVQIRAGSRRDSFSKFRLARDLAKSCWKRARRLARDHHRARRAAQYIIPVAVRDQLNGLCTSVDLARLRALRLQRSIACTGGFSTAERCSFRSAMATDRATVALRDRLAVRSDQPRENAGSSGRAVQSNARAVVSPTPQRRVRDPARQRLGNIL
jgi:hypothetical protein